MDDATKERIGFDEAMADEPVETTAEATTSAETEPVWDRPWQFVDDDGKPLDGEALTAVRGVLERKIAYRAANSDRRDPLDDLVRVAQRAIPAEQRAAMLVQQRNEADQRATAAEASLKGMTTEKDAWLDIMMDPTGKKFLDAQTAFFNAGGKALAAAPAQTGQPVSTYSPEEQARGETVYQQQLVPRLQDLASRYGYNGAAPSPTSAQWLFAELDRRLRDEIAKEGRFMQDPAYAQMRLTQVLEHDFPQMLRENGWAMGTAPAAPPVAPDAALTAENAKLKADLAKARVRSAPPAASGAPAGNAKAPPDLSKVKSYAELKRLNREGAFDE